jgi:hypothetical protein
VHNVICLPKTDSVLSDPPPRRSAAVREVLHDWSRLSKQARQCAVEVFDSVKIFAEYSLLGARFAVAKRFSGDTRCPVMADLIKQSELKDRMKKIPEWELEKKPNRAHFRIR